MSIPPYAALAKQPEISSTEANEDLFEDGTEKNTYVGALPAKQAVTALYNYIRDFYSDSGNTDHWGVVLNSRLALHGLPTRKDGGASQALSTGGSHGQLMRTKTNHYRNIHQHSVNQTTQEEPSFQPIATNTDSESIKQANLAGGLLDYYRMKCRLSELFDRAADDAFCDSEAFIFKQWDAAIGDDVGQLPEGVDPETGQPTPPKTVKTGDFKFSNVLTEDLIRDTTKRSFEACSWVIVREWENKYELAAKNPELAAKLVRLSPPVAWPFEFQSVNQRRDGDDVAVYHFLHDRTAAVPKGRELIFTDDNVILFDGPLPYREIPVYKVSAGSFKNSVFSYSPMWDLLSLQENYDILMSIILSNQKAFGHQIITGRTGQQVSLTSLGTGLSYLEYTGNEPPQPMNLTMTAPEIFSHLDRLEHLFEILSGVSATVRGAPPKNLESGSALAAVYSQFQSYMGKFQKTHRQVQALVATGIIHDLQDFGNHERTALIAGKTNKYQMQSFVGEDLAAIDRVTIEDAAPLSRSMQGRVAQAEMLLQNGLIKRPEEFQNVLSTGKIEPMVEGEQKELDGVREENELIANGQPPPPALITDNHLLHMKEHQGELSTMMARGNPAVLQAGLGHMQQHLQFLTDPNVAMMLAALGQQSMAMPGGPVGAPQAPAPKHGAEPKSGAPPEQPAPPSMPTNPIDGQKMQVGPAEQSNTGVPQ